MAELKRANPSFFSRVTMSWDRWMRRSGARFITKKRWIICCHGKDYYLIYPGSLELQKIVVPFSGPPGLEQSSPAWGHVYYFPGYDRATLTIDLRKGVVIAGPLEVLATYVAAEEQRRAARIAAKQRYSNIFP